jgi:hypothetical protein
MEQCKSKDCNQDATIVICYQPLYVRSCDEHYKQLSKEYLKSKRPRNANLGQVVDTYKKADGSLGKITYGKDSEIKNRTITPEGQVINKQSGKDAQY